MKHIIALSGGKDSTAMALRLAEINPDIDYEYICTPTGDELPEMKEHWQRLESILQKPINKITNKSLYEWIEHFDALPNWRQRWCTRLLKIQPCLAYIKSFKQKPALYVGLRADEEERKGIYSENVKTIFPLREWGWDLQKVKDYLKEKCIKIPRRTDCSMCFYQKISEWFYLWRDNRDYWDKACSFEEKTGHTFFAANRYKWGSSLKELQKNFEKGIVPHGATNQLQLFDMEQVSCRVCRL